MRGKYLVGLLAIALLDCSDLGLENSGTVVITTNKGSYVQSEPIVFTVRNLSSPTAYIWHCNHRLGYWVQKQENGIWREFDERYMLCAAVYLMGGQPILPGQPYGDTVQIQTSGTYRLEMGVGWDQKSLFGHRIYSNIFLIR